jgi:4,5-dihydroxyphthalate decarboxylase
MTTTSTLDKLSVRLGAYRYATTKPLLDGTITVPGARETRTSTGATLPEVFKAFASGDTDVSEFGLTFLLRALEAGEKYVAVPVFPNRVFRHSCVFVSAASGITSPEQLVDRTIGEFGIYGQDSGVWAKGILMDEYAFRPESNRWVIGGLEYPMAPFDFTTHPAPDDVDVKAVPDRSLVEMLAEGELDALFTANVPWLELDGDPRIKRLFPDYQERERDWYSRTGIFPMMHTVAVRPELVERHPDLPRAIYDAFSAAKQSAVDEVERGRYVYGVTSMLPWTNALYEQDVALMGRDWWPYGIKANRHALETYLRYHHKQGLSARRWTVDELFAPDLLDT